MIKSFRLRYFLGHLCISLIIALLALYLVFGVWYPAPLDKAAGVGEIILIMLAIDVTLGPLLTLVLAKEGKKGLKFDLIVVGIVQLSALLYGIYSVERGRPVWLGFDLNRFELVQSYMVDKGGEIAPEYRTDNWIGPKWVSARPAKDKSEESDWLWYELEKGASPAMRPALFQSLEQNMDRVVKEKLPLSDLKKFNKQADIDKVLSQYPQADGFLPMRASQFDMTVLIDSKNKQVVEVVDLRPW